MEDYERSGKTFIAYKGSEFSKTDIVRCLEAICPTQYTVKTIVRNQSNLVLAKIVYNNYKEDRDPYFLSNKTVNKFNIVNEIVIRNEELNTLHANVFVDESLLEKYVGDGLLIATSFGSTAYNLSFGGSIVFNTFDTLQLTPIAPLNNKSYRNLINSVIIPSNKIITIEPNTNDNNLLITVDGKNTFLNEVEKIKIVINNKTINIIRKKDYDFIKKVNEKFIK